MHFGQMWTGIQEHGVWCRPTGPYANFEHILYM